ncbi:hypothetical protein C8A03DRAFT_37114 [Achaetomium macrosporum]|uniref:Uncharacterized protein n=1 Tax=Achaetomium macrosporum TaxID=79813 RepID=A0AAN7C456_9PEZI|nr:hypothetical protein C8A03DRAFT_37114 [Achaetomium macrosporum]
MRNLNILLTLTTLILTSLGAPASHYSNHPLAARDGPCDAYSETCRPVLQANACFAEFVSFGTREQMLQCVDDQDAARAEQVLCACYGCAETTVQDWTVRTLGCKA